MVDMQCEKWAGLLPLRLDDPKAFYLHMPWLASMLAEVEQHSQPVDAQLQQLQQTTEQEAVDQLRSAMKQLTRRRAAPCTLLPNAAPTPSYIQIDTKQACRCVYMRLVEPKCCVYSCYRPTHLVAPLAHCRRSSMLEHVIRWKPPLPPRPRHRLLHHDNSVVQQHVNGRRQRTLGNLPHACNLNRVTRCRCMYSNFCASPVLPSTIAAMRPCKVTPAALSVWPHTRPASQPVDRHLCVLLVWTACPHQQLP